MNTESIDSLAQFSDALGEMDSTLRQTTRQRKGEEQRHAVHTRTIHGFRYRRIFIPNLGQRSSRQLTRD